MPKTNPRPSPPRQLVAQLLVFTLLCQSGAQLASARAQGRDASTPGATQARPRAAFAGSAAAGEANPGGLSSAVAPRAGAQAASCPAATSAPRAARLTYLGQVFANCGEPLPVSARLTDECGNALAGRRLDFGVGGLTASATTDDNGVAGASLVPPPAATPLPLEVVFGGDDAYATARDSAAVRVERVSAVLRYTGPTTLASGAAETVSATLVEALTGRPVAGAAVRFEVGSVGVSATTDARGVATAGVTLPAAETFERAPLRITFAGDDCRGPASASAEVTAYLRTSFVVWGGNSERLRLGQRVNFWGHSWAKQVAQGDYKAHNDFKGYADTVRQFGLCQVNVRTGSRPPLDNSCWSTKPGQSFPPQTIPEHIGVIVTTSADKAGAPDFGNVAALVVVKVDPQPAYGAVPGKPGFGRVVAVIADGEGVFAAAPALAASQTQPAAVLPAQSFNVALTVSNTSSAAASGVNAQETFTNLVPPAASADFGALPAGGSQTRTFGATVPALEARREGESSQDYQKRLGAAEGTVYASFGVVSFRDAAGRAPAPVEVASLSRLRIPRLAVGISAASCVSPGAAVPYVVRLTNVGGAAAAAIAAVVTLPDGTTARVETGNLEPGQVFSSTVNWSVPPVAPKGPAETDADYLARLRSLDGKALRAAASVTWRDALGNAYGAIEQECSSVERVPILSQTAPQPPSMLPGQRLSLPTGVRNTGSGQALRARLRATGPDGTVFDAAPFDLAADNSADVQTTLTAPPVAPKDAAESDADYETRLRAADTRPLDFALALEWADAQGNNYGPVLAAPRAVEVLPVVRLSLSAPETVEAGETITYRVTAENVGHAEAAVAGLSLTLPGGGAQPVALPVAALQPGDTQSAVADFAVPAAQPEGEVSAQATLTWRDAIANGYGPVSAVAATNVLNPNRPPVVDAGPDLSIVLPGPAALDGAATDDGRPAGSALAVQWTKVSGPGAVAFADPARAVTSATFGAEGVYVLRLSASDSALSASDEATVTVTSPPAEPTYGEEADLTEGEGVNVVRDEFNHLRLSNEATPFNFIWVAVSSKGTLVKIDTDTGKVLGEYFTSPAGQPRNPSRTTVDLNGNVWASNRNGNSVLRVGLQENGQCVDRNGNGVIDTSTGFGDLRPWTNAGGADTAGGVSTAADECIINYTRVRARGTRHVSVNSVNDVWVSGTDGEQFDLIDGKTGQIKRQEASVGYGGYGGLIDKNGVIWSARRLLRWDTALPLKGANGGNWQGWGHDSYGLCIDSQGNVWNTAWAGNAVRKFAPDGTLLGTFNHGSHRAQGCVVDRNGHVWVAHSMEANTVGRLKPDGTYVGKVPVGGGPTGVAVDAKGKIWATNHDSRTVSRIDPELGPMGEDGETRVGAVDLTTIDLKGNLYNYSDMTGSTLSGAPSGGTWTRVFDSQLADAQWGVGGWDGRVCGDAALQVSVSSSRDGVNFSPPAAASNGAPFSVPAGRYLKVSVAFRRGSSGESPFLYALTVGTKGYRLPAAANAAPSVNAGPDQTATMPNAANLAGSACDAGRVGDPLEVNWEKVSGPGEVTFADARVPATTATFAEAGEYVLRLTAGDAELSSADELTVLVLPFNDPPTVNAGADQSVILPAPAALAGTVTDDALPKHSSVSVSWSKLSGPGEVAFADAAKAATAAAFSEPGDYVLRLAGDDSQLANVDDLKVKVYPPNLAPAVSAGEDRTVRLPEKAALDATVNDDGLPLGKAVTFAWTKVSGPGAVSFANAKAADTTAAFSLPGAYVLRLTATDSQLSAADELSVTVNPANQPPAANAGPDQTVTLPGAASLAGAVNDDELPEGRTLTAAWTKVSGPGAVGFSKPNEPATAATFSEAGVYVLRLTAGDSALTRSDDVSVTVHPSPVNLPPNVNAGPDQTVTLPAKAALAGAASDDRQPAGSALALSWSKASGPGNVTFANAAAASTAATFSAAGDYVLRLTANDSALTTADEINIKVLPVNQPPVVKAGADQVINFPSAAKLAGSVTDDGQPPASSVASAWTKVSGPGEVTFADAGAPATAAAFSAGGKYVLRLSATDSALTRADDVAVTVNRSPTADAGPDKSVHLPGAVALAGAVTDDALPPGKVIVVAWTKVSGPGAVSFSKPNASATSATFGEVGTYVLRLSANDTMLQAGDEVTVNVLPPLPPPPSVAINSPADGADITSRASVTGSVSHGTWKLEYSLGPDPAAPQAAAWTTFATGAAAVSNAPLGVFDPTLLLNGTYVIRLTATDADGQSGSAAKTVTVTGQQKVGNFTISFRDLEIPVAGLPIKLIRTYDSRDKRRGDFGVGWSLSISNIRLEKSVELGRYWKQVRLPGSIPSYCVQPARANIVTVTFPDERVYRFQATVAKQCQAVSPLNFVRFGFTPMPGTRGTLIPEAPLDVAVEGAVPGEAELLDLADPRLGLYDPEVFRFTDERGFVYVIDQKTGVRSVTDTAGNRLTVGRDGVTHSSGKGVAFARDPQGRITRITDPLGSAMTYAYDARGDLTAFRDREGNETRFTYNDAHGLLGIIDPRGLQPVRNDYDAAGRLVSHTDADGRTITYRHDLDARQELVTDRLGHATLFEYDQRGNVVRVTDAEGAVTASTYDARDNKLSETNALGEKTAYAYDAAGNLVTITHPSGAVERFTHNARGQVLTAADPRGGVTANTYDARGNLLSVRDPLGQVTAYAYGAGGLLASVTDASGAVARFEYDRAGNLSKETDALGHTAAYTYDANGNELSVRTTRTTAAGVETLETLFEYDKLDRPLKTTYADGATVQAAYNSVGQRVALTDPLGRKTAYEYDTLGRPRRAVRPDGTSVEAAYDAEGRVRELKDAEGRATRFSYDRLGRATGATYADGSGVSTRYDALGRVTASVDALGNATRYEYELNAGPGGRTRITDALNRTTVREYDANGNPASVTDASNYTLRYEYDAAGRRTKTVYPDSSSVTTSYDAVGRVVATTDRAGKTTRFAYDAAGRLTQVTDALGQATRYGYDEAGARVSQTDALGRTTTFEYDRAGRRVRRVLPLGAAETNAYDAAGNLVARTDFAGKVTAYAYDALNRLVRRTPDASLSEPPVAFTYTPAGRRASMTDATGTTLYTYDLRGRLASKATPRGTLSYTYDAASNLLGARSSNPDGVSVAYAYDALNRLTTVTDLATPGGARPATGATAYAYTATGMPSEQVSANGLRTAYTYDQDDRLTGVALSRGGPLASYSYTLDVAGSKRSATEHTGRAVRFDYDDLYRLVSETATGDPSAANNGSIAYSFDAVGNRLERASSVASVPAAKYSYDARDRLSAEGYDANGNTTRSGDETYAYDSENRLKAAGGVTFAYDGDGNLASKTSGGVTTHYLADDRNPTGRAQVLEEIVGGRVRRVYTYGHRLVSQSRLDGGQWAASFYGYDGRGDVRLLTDGAGSVTDTYTYDSFGVLLESTGATPNHYLYKGERRDADVGLTYLRARYLNNATGRFSSMDAFGGDQSDPRTLHRYAYAAQNPVEYADPDGLFFGGLAEVGIANTIRNTLVEMQTLVGYAVLDTASITLLDVQATAVADWENLLRPELPDNMMMAGVTGRAISFALLGLVKVGGRAKITEAYKGLLKKKINDALNVLRPKPGVAINQNWRTAASELRVARVLKRAGYNVKFRRAGDASALHHADLEVGAVPGTRLTPPVKGVNYEIYSPQEKFEIDTIVTKLNKGQAERLIIDITDVADKMSDTDLDYILNKIYFAPGRHRRDLEEVVVILRDMVIKVDR